jgi:hypothetical protein
VLLAASPLRAFETQKREAKIAVNAHQPYE